MASQTPFSEHEKLLRFIAFKVLRRVHAAGAATAQLEDIFQELCIAWCQARDKWNASHNVPFGAYLMRGMSHHINRWAQRELREHTIAPFDLDQSDSAHTGQIGAKPHNGLSLHEVIADESHEPIDEALITKDLRDYARNPIRWRDMRLSEPLLPETEKYLDLMDNPPPALIKMISGIQMRAAYGRKQLGIPSASAPKRLTGGLIFDIMGIDPKCRVAVQDQVKRLQAQVNQQ